MAVKPRPDYWGERLALSHESSPNPAQSDLRRGLRLGLGVFAAPFVLADVWKFSRPRMTTNCRFPSFPKSPRLHIERKAVLWWVSVAISIDVLRLSFAEKPAI